MMTSYPMVFSHFRRAVFLALLYFGLGWPALSHYTFLFEIQRIENISEEEEEDHVLHATKLRNTKRSKSKLQVPVFYNLFVNDTADAQRVRYLVLEQFAYLQPEHDVYLHSIGVPLDNLSDVAKLLGHHEQGTEMITLHSLWEYCSNNIESKVVYLHSKGSYTPTKQNDKLRRFLTGGALSRECLLLPSTCNVCSSRMSPIPHPHTPGNMWLARCDYISQLIDPYEFDERMGVIPNIDRNAEHCVGRGRFAAEHWVYSHPLASPCDLSTNRKYVWGYSEIPPNINFTKDLTLAPRFPLNRYINIVGCKSSDGLNTGMTALERIQEYRILYNQVPTETWWGWESLILWEPK
jgi:hypothetical protein